MARVKRGKTTKKRHKKLLKLAKGYRGAKHRSFKQAKETVLHALDYSYRGRKIKKRDFRKLWIIRINAELRPYNLSYSKFINLLKKAGVQLNRKVLADMAISDKVAFANLVQRMRTIE